jgi:hypothetical protein
MASQPTSPLAVGQVLEITFPTFTPRITIRSETRTNGGNHCGRPFLGYGGV